MLEFVKMHGIGNDYVYVDLFHHPAPENPAALAIEISRPHTGVGADGLIFIEPCADADARMHMFNADGSESEMCGNGVRCVGKYLYDSGLAHKPVIRVQTGAGIKVLEMCVEGGVATGARVDMGEPILAAEKIPVAGKDPRITLHAPAGGAREFICVSMGNPHAVTFDKYPQGSDFFTDGAYLETCPAFPHRANIEFVRVEARDRLTVHVWERGSGETLACGTGACASLVAGVLTGRTGRDAVVALPGGELQIEWDQASSHVFMTGPAAISFTGCWTDRLADIGK